MPVPFKGKKFRRPSLEAGAKDALSGRQRGGRVTQGDPSTAVGTRGGRGEPSDTGTVHVPPPQIVEAYQTIGSNGQIPSGSNVHPFKGHGNTPPNPKRRRPKR